MKLFSLIKKFRNDESGAVTVDWVVLTAAIVGLGIVVMNVVGGGIESVATGINDNLTDTTIGYEKQGDGGEQQ
ncbi:Flp family type IVb pilin [Ruixingdingia sedimenti]|uniref:Pilus assembly protein n=1 Tax=Ruixingdingia sedimenti TaxID=3073604 RepID=A0ABU1F568_9RHOB|nr:pilus assembly protein [Xinfangfangia sp. LG-4]MDR5651974.1 pilus assembly protein [Xinfangfangia sp. LG-4]